MVLGMFDGVYAKDEFALLLALIPTGARDILISFRQSGYRTTLTAAVDAVNIEFSVFTHWARGDVAINVSAGALAALNQQIRQTPSTRIWVQAAHGRISIKPEPFAP